jgi:hypothetical protein
MWTSSYLALLVPAYVCSACSGARARAGGWGEAVLTRVGYTLGYTHENTYTFAKLWCFRVFLGTHSYIHINLLKWIHVTQSAHQTCIWYVRLPVLILHTYVRYGTVQQRETSGGRASETSPTNGIHFYVNLVLSPT